MIKLVELFAGIGSQTQALKNLGIEHEVVGISEIDEKALLAYEALHGRPNNLGDITKIEKLPICDLLTYSFPCQDLSVCGKQAGIKKGTRSGLLLEVGRLLEAYNKDELPTFLQMENVTALISKKFIGQFQEWCIFLSSLGYRNTFFTLKGTDVGIPQTRPRVFMISQIAPKNYALNLKIKKCVEFVEFIYGVKPEDCELPRDVDGLNIDFTNMTGALADVIKRNKVLLFKNIVDNREVRLSYRGDGAKTSKKMLLIREGNGQVNIGYLNTLTTRTIPIVYDKFTETVRALTKEELFQITGYTIQEARRVIDTGLSYSGILKLCGNSIIVQCLEAVYSSIDWDLIKQRGGEI